MFVGVLQGLRCLTKVSHCSSLADAKILVYLIFSIWLV